MESLWLTYAKRLQAIGSTGLYFSQGEFDRERYREIAEIANEMLAKLGDIPVERIAGLVSDFAKGYMTPKVDVRGAIIEGREILLVREKSDGRWALPGGFADVGRSAAENVVKDIRDEAGLSVAARALYSVRHKAKQPYSADARDFYKLFFLCERVDTEAPCAGGEIMDVGFFSPENLPVRSPQRVVETDIRRAFAFHDGLISAASFD